MINAEATDDYLQLQMYYWGNYEKTSDKCCWEGGEGRTRAALWLKTRNETGSQFSGRFFDGWQGHS